MAKKRDRAPGEGYLIAWSGNMTSAERDTQTALRASGVRVEEVRSPGLRAHVAQRAPDLVVLGQRGEERSKLIDALAEVHPFVPIVALTAAEDARPQPRARFGMVARLDRDQPSPELAEALRALLDGFSRRLPRWRVQAELDDVPQVARRAAMAGRSGLLSATGAGAVALDSDGRIGPDPKLFVASLVGIPELELTLYERPPGSVRVFREPPAASHGDLTGARVLLVDPDPARFAKLAADFEEFEGVKAVSCAPSRLAAERALDPMAIVLSSETLLEAECAPLWDDTRYVPGGLLVLEGRALEGTTVEGLASHVAACAAPERSIVQTLSEQQPVAARLETLGTARWLKVLGQCQHDVTLRVFSAAGRARVDLSEGKIQGASFHLVDRDDVEGRAAVEMLLRLPFGRVLAGAPSTLARFDGMRRTRKPSIVGRIVPMEIRGGKIAGEVVVQHTDTTVPLLRIPSPALDPSGDFADEEEDEATRTYSAEAVAKIREGKDEKETSAEPDDTSDEGTSEKSKPEPKKSKPATAKADEGKPATAKSDDKRKAREGAAAGAKAELDGAEPDAPKPSADEPKKAGRAASGAKKKGKKKRPSKRPAAKREREEPVKNPAAAKTTEARPSIDAAPEDTSSGSPWLWVAALLVFAVGGYGVYRMTQNDAGATTATPSATASPASNSAGAPPPTQSDPPTTPTQVVSDPTTEPTLPEPVRPEPPPPSVDTPAEPDEAIEANVPETPTDEVSDETAGDEPDESTEPEATPDDPPAEVDPSAEAASPPESGEPLPPVPTTSAEITERIQASAAAARVRDYARSEALARLVIEASPRNARAAYRIAVAAFRQRHFDEALEWARNAETWNPEDPLPVSLRGDINMRRGNFNRAAVAYREALEIEPRFGPARRQLDRLQARGIGVD